MILNRGGHKRVIAYLLNRPGHTMPILLAIRQSVFTGCQWGINELVTSLIAQISVDVVDRPNIIYAALFCYRQSIELFIKRLIDEFGKEKKFSPKNTHELNRLWERFICIANEMGGCESIGLPATQKLVEEMHNIDQKSDGFRFPTDVDGKLFISHDKGIDLENLREVMQGVENFFECFYLDWSNQKT